VINACGIYTDLGGIVFSPGVMAAMQEVNQNFVRMTDLLDHSGAIIAELLGAPAARVTTGASGAIALGTAACIAGMDGNAWERLPDTSGLRNEVIIQKAHRYKYDRMTRLAGAKLVETTGAASEFETAINDRTAMIMFPAHLDGKTGTLTLEEVTSVARRRGIPVLVDAAYLNYPTNIMGEFLTRGADLVCFSAKYYWGPNSGGFICGRKDLIDAVAGLDFTRYESGKYLSFGRPFKLDRHTIVGTVVALQEWFAMDHDARWRSYREKVAAMREIVAQIPNISTEARYFALDESLLKEPVNCMTIAFAAGARNSAEQLRRELSDGDPAIATELVDSKLVVAVDTLLDDQHLTIAKRLRELLA